MKKLSVTIIFLLLLLTACSEDNKYSESGLFSEVQSENSVEKDVEDKYFGFNINEKGIDIIRNGDIVQTIETDYLKNYPEYFSTTPEMHLGLYDYDFDGYGDLFIPTDFADPNTIGVYYHYNPETALLEEWDELNKIGIFMTANDDNTLLIRIQGSEKSYEEIFYKWEDSSLKKAYSKFQYARGRSNQIYVDTFEYDENENEILKKREKLIESINGDTRFEEIGIKPFYDFKVSENSIDIISDGEYFQTIEGDFSYIMQFSVPTDSVKLYDVNFDDYDDLFIPTKYYTEGADGIYYKFSPEKNCFEEWEELNKYGHSFNVGISTNVSIGKILSYNTEDHQTFVYYWDKDNKDTLVLFRRIETVIDKENNMAVTNVYYIDADGNEILEESVERNLDYNPLDFD